MIFDDLIGRPWAVPCDPPETYDCWSLVVETRRRLGLPTFAYQVPPQARTLAHRRDLATPDPRQWQRLDAPHDGCLVGFGGKLVKHCGMYWNGQVIHAGRGFGVVVQSFNVCRMFMGGMTFWDMRDVTD